MASCHLPVILLLALVVVLAAGFPAENPRGPPSRGPKGVAPPPQNGKMKDLEGAESYWGYDGWGWGGYGGWGWGGYGGWGYGGMGYPYGGWGGYYGGYYPWGGWGYYY